MSGIDVAVVVAYVIGMVALGARLGAGASGLRGYFLGDSNVPAWAVMISIVATETSTATFLSVPALSYAEGGNFTFLQLALGYIAGRVFVAIVLLPAYFRGRLLTAYEVLDRRFGGATKTTASVLFLATRTLGDGLRLYLAARVVQELMLLGGVGAGGWVMPAAIGIMGFSTLVYTYLGGMKAVVWTDVVQFFLYVAGAAFALVLMVRGITGGWGGLMEFGRSEGKFRVLDFSTDPTRPFTFWCGVIGGMALSTATHGADQLMVQRYLSARSRGQAGGALVASGFVVFAQFALFLLIGVALAAFYREHPPDRVLGKDGEFAYFVVRYLPPGVLGLVMAAIFAAAMSTLSSSLNASAAATISDLVRPLAPSAGEERLLAWSKRLTIAWALAQMGVALYASRFLAESVISNVLTIASFITGLVLGLFLLARISRRAGQGAALAGMLAGLVAVGYANFGPALGLPYPLSKPVAGPWLALIGSSTVLGVGLLVGTFGAGRGSPASEEFA